MKTKNTRLVYSTDPALMQKCKQCKELMSECTCVKETISKKPQYVAILRIEKKGRKGKTVTLIEKLPKIERFLKDLTYLLKSQCGSGGTYLLTGAEGTIEIQGDKRELIKKILTREGIPFKP